MTLFEDISLSPLSDSARALNCALISQQVAFFFFSVRRSDYDDHESPIRPAK